MIIPKETFDNLMANFKQLPPLKVQQPTFLEITEFPHYENVCSNILKFYFDSNQPHGLNNLLLKSLFQLLNQDIYNIESVRKVKREEITNTQKRIDLLIELDSTVILIENKINHFLTDNQLKEYYGYATNNFKNEKILFVLLSLENIDFQKITETSNNKPYINDDATKGFKPITYTAFFKQIRTNLGEFVRDANTKYLTFFLDFMASIENLNSPNYIDSQLRNFVIKNSESIEYINKAYQAAWDEIYNKAKNIKRSLLEQYNYNVSIWDRRVVYFSKQIDNHSISIDCHIQLNNVIIEIRVLNSSDRSFLDKLDIIKDSSYKENSFKDNGYYRGYFVYQSEKNYFDTPDCEIIAKINEILPKIKISE